MKFVLSMCLILSIKMHETFSLPLVSPLYEGSSCPIENIGIGICKKITECPSRLKEVKLGKRNAFSEGRCGFEGMTEIVCCPLQNTTEKIGIRPAEIACRQYENEISAVNIVFHITGGTEASSNEFPYTAALGYEDKDEEENITIKYDCGGTLISMQHVLTAAHCVSNIADRTPIEVRMGSNDLRSNSQNVQRIRISDITTHPEYKRSLDYNDMAVLKLQNPVRLTETVRPICLQTKPVSNILSSTNASFIVIGWGATGFDEYSSPLLLKTPSMSLVERSTCESSYSGFRRLARGLDESMICAMDRNVTRRADSCQGDSGGPLLMITNATQTLIGVTATGQACGSSVPAIYMSVHAYLDWIESLVWPDINKK